MEEIGDRTTVFEFGGLRDRRRDYIDWVLKISLEEGVTPEDIMTDAAATRLAAKLKTPLQIGQHLVRAFEAGSRSAPSLSTRLWSKRCYRCGSTT